MESRDVRRTEGSPPDVRRCVRAPRVLGPLFAALITGSIVVERVFAVAGLGEYFITTIMENDYPMIMGITIFYAVLIIASMLLVDIAYGFIDPRLRVGKAKA